MGCILGIDQGATKTAAVVMDDRGRILGVGRSGGGNYFYTGMDIAINGIKGACMQALQQAVLQFDDMDTLSAGISGADWPEDYDRLHQALFDLTGHKNITVYNDCIIAMRGGTDQPSGAVICIGTGLNVAVRSPAGETYIFGYYIDMDHQGASAIGNLAVKAVIASEAGVKGHTTLTNMILREFGLKTVDDLLRHYVGGKLSGNMKELAPQVLDLATAGDRTAADLVADFATGAAKYVTAGLKRFNMLDLDVDIVFSGSVLKSKNVEMREQIKAAICQECRHARIIDAIYEPVVGAALLGMDEKTGNRYDDAMRNTIFSSCKAMNLLRMDICKKTMIEMVSKVRR